jgi:hypothetical protein
MTLEYIKIWHERRIAERRENTTERSAKVEENKMWTKKKEKKSDYTEMNSKV